MRIEAIDCYKLVLAAVVGHLPMSADLSDVVIFVFLAIVPGVRNTV